MLRIKSTGTAITFAGDAELVGNASNRNRLACQEFLQNEMRLTTVQLAKVIATFPPVLGLSIVENLKPTVEWIKGLGLSQSQVAKVILQRPQVLGLSIEANMKPAVEWMKGLGMSQCQVGRLIAAYPPVFGRRIDSNLSLKHRLLQEYFPGAQAAGLLAQSPQLWGYRYARLENRLSVLKSHNQLSKLVGAMTLPLDAFSRRYPGT